MSSYQPLSIKLRGKQVLIIGGGKTALRKALSLSDSNPKFVFISPEILGEIFEIFKNAEFIKEKFSISDHLSLVENSRLIFICAEKSEADLIFQEIKSSSPNTLVLNCADHEKSDFILNKVISRGDIKVSISSSGKSPVASLEIAKAIDKALTDELLEKVGLIIKLREKLKFKYDEPIFKGKHVSDLSSDELSELLREISS